MKRIIPFLLLLSVILPTMAEIDHKASIDSIRRELTTVTTSADSLSRYLDIYDLLSRSRKKKMADSIFYLAQRAGDRTVQLEMLRSLTNFYTNDDSLRLEYQHRAEEIKASNEQRLTLLYINLINSIQAARNPARGDNLKRLKDLTERAKKEKGASLFTRLEMVMTLCSYFEDYSQKGLLKKYLDQAGVFVSHLPERNSSIDNMLLTQSAINYISVGDLESAVKTDQQLLKLMDSVEIDYHNRGRKFRNYDYNRYIVYRRILSNYPVLTDAQVKEYYAQCLKYADLEPSAKAEMQKGRRAEIYYLMARKRYKEVIPLLRRQIKATSESEAMYIRRKLINALIEAATAEGDREALVDGLKEYRVLNENNKLRRDPEEYSDLQFVFETNSLSLERSQMEVERQESVRRMERQSRRSERVILSAVCVVTLILVLVIIFMWRTSRRMKQLNRRRAKDNAALIEERDTLRRTQQDLLRASENAREADRQREEFVSNVSNEIKSPVTAIVEYSQLIVDCIDDDKHSYLDRFALVVKLNAELLMALVNDVLDVASHDKGTLKMEKRPIGVNAICTVAVDTVKDRLQPGVTLINEVSSQPDVMVDTDAKRVAQVLTNLLGNAAKFTEEGTITLAGSLSADGTKYTFTVTDTGIGIPEGKEEEIFERFKKLSKYSQGVGLGLHVSRMIAELLGGTVKVDRSYEAHGARFIFTIAVK